MMAFQKEACRMTECFINRRTHLSLWTSIGIIMAAVAAVSAVSLEAGADLNVSDRGVRGVGPVFGVSMDPEQVHVGIRFGMGELSNRLDLRSGLEAGFGDHHTRGAFLIDALYRFRDRWDVWQPYAGGGLGLGVHGHDHGRFDDDDTDVEPGLNIIGGVAKGVRGDDIFQTELRIGIGEAPDFGLSVGWLFR
jgi:hypothetical protein